MFFEELRTQESTNSLFLTILPKQHLMKNKIIAAILAFPFGIFGLHRFYLGQRLLGILYFVFFFFTLMLTMEERAPFVMVPALVAFIDAILLYVMPKEDFDEKYNRKRPAAQNHLVRKREYVETARDSNNYQNLQYFKRRGIAAYRLHDFEEAIINFNRALDFQPDDPALHFNLACCHSNLEESEDAFFHLEKAIEFGFDDLDKIHEHKALAYVRSLEDFDFFVENDYRVVSLPLPSLEGEEPDEVPDTPSEEEKNRSYQLLVKLKELAELRDKGILTEEEFAEQKRRLIDRG